MKLTENKRPTKEPSKFPWLGVRKKTEEKVEIVLVTGVSTRAPNEVYTYVPFVSNFLVCANCESEKKFITPYMGSITLENDS